jgi:signal transduction histidine kinase
MSSHVPGLTARQGDALLAAALSLLLVLELSFGSNITGDVWVNFPLGLAMTAAVAFRRPWSVSMLALALVAALAATLLDGDLTENTLAPFLSVILIAYGVGAYAPRPWMEYGVGIGVVLMVLVNLAGDRSGDVGEHVATVLIAVLGPWFAGRVTREWAGRARELERVNRALRSEQEQRSLLAVSDERSRIARELHDVVAHSISVMVVQSEGAKRMLEKDPKRARAALEQIEGTGRAALVEMRRLLGVLRRDEEDARRTPQPGMHSLDLLVDRAQETGLDVRLAIEGARRDLPAGVDVSVYRIIQEALTNSLKHAGKTRADVLLTYGDAAVEIEVVDAGMANGHNPPTADPENPQHGLLGMRERVELYGGELVTGPCEDGRDGYRVWARIPLTER